MGPYGETAWAYRAAGWAGVLPLPVGAKWPPPGGYTGWAGVEPSGADVQAWIDGAQGAGNIGLRLPTGVYGLDVDGYGAKGGAAALARLVNEHGPLPPTWTVTSRDDGVSGIRLFLADLPPGRRWRDEPGGHGAGIEAIHRGHRYAVTWPSMHPETGRKYVWHSPDGLAVDGACPTPTELPELPAAWIEALSQPGEARTGEAAGHDETITMVTAWRDGDACPRVRVAHERALTALAAASGGDALHPAIVAGTYELACLGHEGHAGVRRALAEHYAAAIEVRASRGLARGDAEGEWWRAMRGAVGKLVRVSARERCDCDLWAGAGLLFDPSDLGSAKGDLFDEPASVAEDGEVMPAADAYPAVHPDIRDELWRREVRRQADGIEHARVWEPPRSHGDLASELMLPDSDPEWRIHGLLGNGHNAVLVAGRKAGKTTMVNEVVRAYVDGGMFLGTQPVVTTGAGIAVFNYEVDERQYRRWLRAVGIQNTHLVHVLHLRGRSLPMANGRVRAWVAGWLRERGVTGWIVDPYSRAYIGSVQNGNDEAQVSAFLDSLDVVKSEAGVTELIMPVHTPKGRADEGSETAIGSQRLEAWPDVMWYLTRDGKTRFIRAEGRDVEFDESELKYDESTRRLRVEMFGQDRKTSRLSAGLERLIRFVRANPECTQNMIMAALGWNAKTVREVVAASGGLVIAEPGPNRSLIHILKEDISGVTQKKSHTESDHVIPGLVGGVTLPVGESPPHPVSVTDQSHVTPEPLEPFDPFDLVGGDLDGD